MTTASLSRRVLTGLLGLTLAIGLAACGSSPGQSDPGGESQGGSSGESTGGSSGESTGGSTGESQGPGLPTDLSGGTTMPDRYEGESVDHYLKGNVYCIPDWVATPSGNAVYGHYIEVLPESATEGVSVCAAIWNSADAAGVTQSLSAKSSADIPPADKYTLMGTTMANGIYTAFRNPLVNAIQQPSFDFDALQDAYASEFGATLEAYGDDTRTLFVLTPTGRDLADVGVVYAVACEGRC